MNNNKMIRNIRSRMVPLPLENVDTDQIIPSRFLKATTRTGFKEGLFHDWRYDHHDRLQPDFVLNNPSYAGNILVAGKNFGCGSSREHAAWAIKDYGFDVVISSAFADIFRNNALNNFLLPVTVSELFLQKLFTAAGKDPRTLLEINLEQQSVILLSTGRKETFDIDPYKKNCLLNGLDDIDFLLNLKPEIELFENSSNHLKEKTT